MSEPASQDPSVVVEPQWRHWRRLMQRFGYLLYAEGFLRSTGGISNGKPVLCNTRTARAIIESGASAIPRLLEEFSELQVWPGWPSMETCMREGQQLIPEDASPFLTDFAPPPPAEGDDDPKYIPQLLDRVAYMWQEEFSHRPIGWTDLTRSVARLLDLGSIPALISALLNETQPVRRQLWRRCLERGYGVDAGLGDEDEGAWWRSLWSITNQYPGSMVDASESQLAELVREGVISQQVAQKYGLALPSQRPLPSAACDLDGPEPNYELAEGRFRVDARVPGSQGSALDWGRDQTTGRAVLVTKLFVLEGGGEGASGEGVIVPAQRRMALDYPGIAPLLLRERVVFVEGHANVIVEALPEGQRGDLIAPLVLAEVATLVEKTATIVAGVHAGGELVLGLRPETVFVNDVRDVELAPRGPLFRRLSWPNGANVEQQLPPFASFYLPLEVLGTAAADAHCDVFSLCACALYWLSGRAPIAGGSQLERMHALMTAPSSVDLSGLPECLRGICQSALASAPDQRPSLAEFRGAWAKFRY